MLKLNFANFINTNSTLTAEEKVRLLDLFCDWHNYTESQGTKVEFFNDLVTNLILSPINSQAKKEAEEALEYDKLVLEAA
ncbi:MAG: hypothetical protein GY861_03275 [bacterium]|nr:hypothetical protein [bacterium]